MSRWITLHDAESNKKRFPGGRPVRVRADAIFSLRGYPDGRERTVVGIGGGYYLHTIETEEQVLALVGGELEGGFS